MLFLTAGCNGDGEPDPPDESPSGGETTSSAPSPSESPSSTVEAASGPEMVPEEGSAAMRAPEGYALMPQSLNTAVSAEDPQARGFITLSVLPSAREGDLDELAWIGMKRFDGKPTRLPDVEIQGVTFYHLAGENAVGLHQDHGTPRRTRTSSRRCSSTSSAPSSPSRNARILSTRSSRRSSGRGRLSRAAAATPAPWS